MPGRSDAAHRRSFTVALRPVSSARGSAGCFRSGLRRPFPLRLRRPFRSASCRWGFDVGFPGRADASEPRRTWRRSTRPAGAPWPTCPGSAARAIPPPADRVGPQGRVSCTRSAGWTVWVPSAAVTTSTGTPSPKRFLRRSASVGMRARPFAPRQRRQLGRLGTPDDRTLAPINCVHPFGAQLADRLAHRRTAGPVFLGGAQLTRSASPGPRSPDWVWFAAVPPVDGTARGRRKDRSCRAPYVATMLHHIVGTGRCRMIHLPR